MIFVDFELLSQKTDGEPYFSWNGCDNVECPAHNLGCDVYDCEGYKTLSLDYYRDGGGYTLVTGEYGGNRLMKPRGTLHEVWAFLDGYELAWAELSAPLKALTEFCTSGKRYVTQNPYTVPEITAALEQLTGSKYGKE